jgi:hypothetical protein
LGCCRCPQETFLASPDTEGRRGPRALDGRRRSRRCSPRSKSRRYRPCPFLCLLAVEGASLASLDVAKCLMGNTGIGDYAFFATLEAAARHIPTHTGAAAMKTLTGKTKGEHLESVRVRSGRGHAHCAMGRGIEPNARSNAIPTTYERVRRGGESLHQVGGVSSRLDPNNNNYERTPRPRFQGSMKARSKRGSSTVSFLVLRGLGSVRGPYAAAQFTAHSPCTTRDDGTLSFAGSGIVLYGTVPTLCYLFGQWNRGCAL